METHIGENTCKKYFTTNINLNRHFLTNTRKKPYPCELCDKTFLRNYDWLFILLKKIIYRYMYFLFSIQTCIFLLEKCVLNNNTNFIYMMM